MTPAPVEPPSTTETTCPPSTTSVGTGMQGARNALAIDTRFLDAQGDKTTAYTLIENCHDLVQNAVDRGIAPHIVSWTKLQETKDVKKTARPRAQVVEVHSMCCEADKKLEFAPVLIQPSSANSSSNQSQSVFQVPKLLAASATWKLFSDFGTSEMLEAFLFLQRLIKDVRLRLLFSGIHYPCGLSSERYNLGQRHAPHQ